jgi:hypothetical protein
MSDSVSNSGRPPRGLVGDIHRARTGAKATAEELRAFVRDFRGRSPQEMLGLVAASNLIQATLLATVITFIFMASFTVGPYMMKKAYPVAAKTSKKPAAAAPAPAPSASAAPAPVAATTATAAPLPVATGTGPATPDVLNTLGIGETKASDPKKNPLEAGADDLLKDLK